MEKTSGKNKLRKKAAEAKVCEDHPEREEPLRGSKKKGSGIDGPKTLHLTAEDKRYKGEGCRTGLLRNDKSKKEIKTPG